MCNSDSQSLTFKFGIHNDAVKLYIIEKATGRRKNKSLSFFFGKSFKLQTNIEHWNKKKERFDEEIFSNSLKGKPTPIPTALEDNKKLKALKKQLEELASSLKNSSIDNFLSCYEAAKKIDACKVPTLLEYATTLCELWKTGNATPDCPQITTNYQLYAKFTNKLQGKIKGKTMEWANDIKKFADMPISNIDLKVYEEFVTFIIENKISKETIRYFSSVVHHYFNTQKKDIRFSCKGIDNIFKRYKQNKHTSVALTDKQFQDFINVDLRNVLPKYSKYNQMCYDALLLLYYTTSRPVDIVNIQIQDIDINEKVPYWEYCAYKKRNHSEVNDIEIPQISLCPKAMEIINKYKGNRNEGYLFPFACNVGNKRNRNTNHHTTDMGDLLKKIALYYKWKQKKGEVFCAYSMRKTGITHNLRVYSVENTAYLAQTSIDEIYSVYLNKKINARNAVMKRYYNK